MSKTERRTKTKDKSKKNLAAELNKIPTRTDSTELQTSDKQNSVQSEEDIKSANDAFYNELFDVWDANEFMPQDFKIRIPVDSLEARVGYSSLFRQMHQSFIRTVAFLQTPGGGSLSVEEARRQAFHAYTNKEEAKKLLQTMMRLPLESLNFVDLMELHDFAPRVAERFWEKAKREGRAEFESGHLAANITFPVGYMKQLWNIARYLGVRESFIAEWQPKGGIEIALIDMLAQSYFQWQYWLEQTVKRSQTRPREEHPDYKEWQRLRKKYNEESWMDGYWLPPYVSEQAAIEHAVQMADRFNRIFMRTLRQLRDLRRYSPVTINNPSQVNIANEGGQQINVAKTEEEKNAKKITS
jgi:hypothetical protein